MNKFFLALLCLGLFAANASAYSISSWYNASSSYREVFSLTGVGSANTTGQLIHVNFQNTTGGAFPQLNFSRANTFTNVSVYFRYVNGTEEALFGSSSACATWEAYGYQVNGVLYASLWVRVPSLPTGTNQTQIVIYEGTNGGASQYNETCVFQDTQGAYLFEKNAGAATIGFNSNWNNANASDSLTAVVNRSLGGQAFNTDTSPKFINTTFTNNATAGAYLTQITAVGSFASSYIASDLGAGFANFGFNVANYGCVFNDGATRTAVTVDSNFKNGSTYSMGCFWNLSQGGVATQNLTFLVNGVENASSILGNLGGVAQAVRVGVGTGLTTSPAYVHSFLLFKSPAKTVLLKQWFANVYDTSASFNSSDTNEPVVLIWLPANTTYYNASTTSLVFSLNSSINSTSLKTWLVLNGVTSFFGLVANASTNTTTQNTVNGQNSYTVFAYNGYGASANQYVSMDEGSGSNVSNALNGSDNYTLAATVTFSTYCRQGSCLNFTGNGGGALNTYKFGGYSSFTSCAWAYPNGNTASGTSTNTSNPRIFGNPVFDYGIQNATNFFFYTVVTTGGTATGTAVNGSVDFGKWSFLCVSYDGTNTRGWVNGVNVLTIARTTNVAVPSTTGSMLGNNLTLNRAWNGSIDEFSVYENRSLSQQQIIDLMNLNINRFGNDTVYFTIFNGLNISAYNASQATSTILSSLSVNVSVAANSSVTTGDSNLLIDTRTVPNGATVNVTVTKAGYAVQTVTAFSNASALYTVLVPLWRHQEFHFLNSNGTNATTWTLTIYSGANITTYTTTNGTILVSLGSIPIGNFIGQFSGATINQTNVTFNANASSEINYTATGQSAGLIIYAFDEISCLTVCQRIYLSYYASNATNVTYNFDNSYFYNLTYLQIPNGATTFIINNSVNGSYDSRSYFLSISSSTAQILNAYLINTSNANAVFSSLLFLDRITLSPIPGAQVTISRLIGGSYVTIAQANTSSAGMISLYLDRSVDYLVTATATGYEPLSISFRPFAGVSYFYMSSTTFNPLFSNIFSDENDTVISGLQPGSGALVGNWTLVNFTVNSINSTLTSWGMYCNYNNTIIYNNSNTGSPAGGMSVTNITLTNKTNPTFFNCTGFFNRNGYPTAYVFREWQIYSINQSFARLSIANAVNSAKNANLSDFSRAAIALTVTILAVGVIMGSGAGAPGGVIVGALILWLFAFVGFIPFYPLLAITIIALGWFLITVR